MPGRFGPDDAGGVLRALAQPGDRDRGDQVVFLAPASSAACPAPPGDGSAVC
jgi:hypothetical protein